MPGWWNLDWLPAAAAFGLCLALTPLVRALSRRRGAVAQPRDDRWHRTPTALFGGIAMMASVVAAATLIHASPQLLVVLGASVLMWLIGLIDDVRPLKPYQKLIGQLMVAAGVAYSGLQLPWTGFTVVNIALTLFWLVGITNAVNLLDNMDGLAAGIAAIAAVFLGLCFRENGQAAEAQLLSVLAAALAAFLCYNWNPASIFMGDCGSMFIGSLLAGVALIPSVPGGRSGGLLPVLAVPVLVLAIPIFDTVVVTVARKLAGRAVSQGGRDHLSHRLVALGLSERRAVGLLYGLAALAGVLGLAIRRLHLDLGLALIALLIVGLAILGITLARVQVYEERALDAARRHAVVAFLVELSYKRRIFEVLLDVVLIILAYYFAYVLLFGSLAETGAWEPFGRVLPILVCVKLAAFLLSGVYRGLWRYVGVDDLVTYAKGVVLGSAAAMLAIVFLFRFEGFSRAVFVLDGLLMLTFLAGSRIGFRVLRRHLPHGPAAARRVLIYGAGDGGELLLRELRNNRELGYHPVGFADDDPSKKGMVIHGLRVLGGNGTLVQICRELAVDEVLISSAKIPAERLRELARAKLCLRRLKLEIEPLNHKDGDA